MHPVAVVEQRGRAARPVHQETVKPPIQRSGKRRVLLGQVDEVLGSVTVDIVPSIPEAAGRSGLWKFLAGKQQHHIASFVPQRHAVGERIVLDCPSDVHAEALIDPGACSIKRLVHQRANHFQQLPLGTLARHRRQQTNQSGHGVET